MNPHPNRGLRAALVAFASLASLAACGGGGADGTGAQSSTGSVVSAPTATGSQAYSAGVMSKGSVILNGVRYDDSSAQIADDRNRSAAQLADGMRVKLRGRISDDGVSGSADRVSIEPELRGTVGAVEPAAVPPAFTVGGVRVLVADTTVFADGATLAGIAGRRVEVHGLRDAAGTIRASRVEVLTGTTTADSLRGRIVAVASSSAFTMTGGASGTVAVTLAGTPVFTPSGCGVSVLAAGAEVEVHGSFSGSTANTFSATSLECEDLFDDSTGVRAPSGSRNELEGFVAGLNTTASTFTVNGRTVSWNSSTQIRNGALADLANGVRVEVDGTLSGTTLVAREISLKQERILVQGAVQSVGAGATSFVVLGRTVQVSSLTERDSDVSIAVGVRVQVRGTLSSTGALLADEIGDPSGSSGREFVQARVTAKTATSITLLGLTVTLSPSTQYRLSDDAASTSQQAFLDAVTASPTGGTLVKVRGTPLSAGVEEAEIEQ